MAEAKIRHTQHFASDIFNTQYPPSRAITPHPRNRSLNRSLMSDPKLLWHANGNHA